MSGKSLKTEPSLPHATWTWERTDPGRSGSSGDLAKLFKNEVVKNPGVMALDAPAEQATIMAREVVQNSADAAAELAQELGDDAPELEISFEFKSLGIEDKRWFSHVLDLPAIAARGSNREEPRWRARLGLDDDDVLDHLSDNSPLDVLMVTERGTTGMYGPFDSGRSKMFMALVSLGYTGKSEGSGGSYGYGKAGLIRGSAIRTVVAYTAFRERPDDPGITRRLLGMTYWGQHDLDGDSYTGFARFGAEIADGTIHPFENSDADALADALGLEIRNGEDPDDHGTSFLLIQPTVTADDLTVALARNWWPALEDGRMTVSVTADGSTTIPRPMKDPMLRPFIDAFHLATTDQDNAKPNQFRQAFRRASFGDRQLNLGGLGLIAEPGGWSYEQSDDGTDDATNHRSLVALVRGPRMVVEYLDVGRSRPFVRGAFVAHDDIDELLRQTEPKAHDSWQTRGEEPGSDPEAARVADTVIRRIRENVKRFRDQLRPAARPAEDVRLPELERLFGRVFSAPGGFPVGPTAADRPFVIDVDQRVEAAGEGLIRLKGTIAFALSDNHQDESAPATVVVSYRFVEEGGNGEEASLTVKAPPEFGATGERPYQYDGTLTRKPAPFQFESEPYPADWTGRLKGDATFRRRSATS